MGRDQGAVDNQIGVAADGGGEVGIGGECQAEVAEILRRIIGLGHRAQNGHVDQLAIVGVLGLGQKAVEMGCFQHLPFGQHHARGLRDFTKCIEFFRRGFLVHPEQKGRAFCDQRLGGGDVGEDHEFFDQPVGIQTILVGDRFDGAVVVQFDTALGQVEIQRFAGGAGLCQRGVSGIKRL